MSNFNVSTGVESSVPGYNVAICRGVTYILGDLYAAEMVQCADELFRLGDYDNGRDMLDLAVLVESGSVDKDSDLVARFIDSVDARYAPESEFSLAS